LVCRGCAAGATLILVLLRAWLRSHIGDVPRPAPVLVIERIEAAQIAAILEDCTFSTTYIFQMLATVESSRNMGHIHPKKPQEKASATSFRPFQSLLLGTHESLKNHSDKIKRLTGAWEKLSKEFPKKTQFTETASAAYSVLCFILKIFNPDEQRSSTWAHYAIIMRSDSKGSSQQMVPSESLCEEPTIRTSPCKSLWRC
jgi:hypothetical protein